MRSASPLAPPGLHGNRLFDAPLRRFASLHGAISTVSRYSTTPMRSAAPLAPPGLHGNRLFDAPLHRFASLHGAISTSRYYTTLLCAAPRHWPRRGCVATGFLMRHCTVLLRCTAQYRQVDIIPPLCAAPRHWPHRGCMATGFLMRHCTVSLPRGGLKIPFYAILKRSFSRL